MFCKKNLIKMYTRIASNLFLSRLNADFSLSSLSIWPFWHFPALGYLWGQNRKLKGKKKKKNTTNKRTCNLKFGLVFWQPLTTHPPKWHWSISLGHENMSLNSRYEISIYSFWWLSKDVWTFPLLWSNKKKTPHKKPLTSLTIQFYIKHRELKLYLLFPRLLFLLF